MSKFACSIALFASLFTVVPAWAQTREAQATTGGKASAQYPQKPQHIDIEDGSDVDGVRANPNVDLVSARGQLRPSSLISIRTDFKSEILKSAESL